MYNNTILGRLFWFKLFNFAKYYFIPSKEIIDNLKLIGVQNKKIVYSPPGINLDQFRSLPSKIDARKALQLPSDKFILSYFGSLTSEKGVLDILKAYKLLNQSTQENILIAIFAISKGSPKHNQIASKINSLKPSHILLVEKYVDIRQVLSASDALILPQQTGHGATIPPISIVEVLASKKPLITTQTIGVRELFGKDNDFLIEPKNPEILAKAIEKMALKMTSLEINIRQFNIENSAKLHLGVYKKLTN